MTDVDAPYFNGEPGEMPYDREHDPREAPNPPVLCVRCEAAAMHWDGPLGYCRRHWRELHGMPAAADARRSA